MLCQAALCYRSEDSVLKVADSIHISVFHKLRNSYIVAQSSPAASCLLHSAKCFFGGVFSHPFRGFFPAAICSVYSWSHNLSFTGLFVVKLPWLLLFSVMPVIVVLF